MFTLRVLVAVPALLRNPLVGRNGSTEPGIMLLSYERTPNKRIARYDALKIDHIIRAHPHTCTATLRQACADILGDGVAEATNEQVS